MSGNIEAYLSGAIEYDALSDAERCAICAGMEGILVYWDEMSCITMESAEDHWLTDNGPMRSIPDYLHDGTAALRLQSKFQISVGCTPDDQAIVFQDWMAYVMDMPSDFNRMKLWVGGDTPSQAIVHAVCALARAQWPYKVTA